MKLYEVNAEMEALLDQLEPDPETGEVPLNEDEIIAKLDALTMKREDILQHLAKLTLDTKANVQALRAEEKRLRDRRQRLENRQEHLMSILQRECGGQKTDLGVATLFYRNTSRVNVLDLQKAVQWLKRHKHTDCYRVPDPEISKLHVGKLLDEGKEIPGIERVPHVSCFLR